MQKRNVFLLCFVLLSTFWACTEDKGIDPELVVGEKITDAQSFQPGSMISNVIREEIYFESDHTITCFNYFNKSRWDMFQKTNDQDHLMLIDINRVDQELYFAVYKRKSANQYDVWLYRIILEYGTPELIMILDNMNFIPANREFFICNKNNIAYSTGPPDYNIYLIDNRSYQKLLPVKGTPKLMIPEAQSMLIWNTPEQALFLYHCQSGTTTPLSARHWENRSCNYYLTPQDCFNSRLKMNITLP